MRAKTTCAAGRTIAALPDSGDPPAAAEPPTPVGSRDPQPISDTRAVEREVARDDSPSPLESPIEDIRHVASAQLEGAGGRVVEEDGEYELAQSATSPGVARNTAIFSIGTGISRVAGLAREIVAASYFGTGAPASAFTIAYLVPNLVANLFANAALSAAFVPVFTDLLQTGRKKEALRLASTLFWILLIGLGAVSAFFILAAGLIMPLFAGPTFNSVDVQLLVGLSQVLFPVIMLLGLTGLMVGILQSYDHFTIQAIAPAVWNLVIIALLVVLAPHFHGQDEIYALAIGVLAATFVQMLMVMGALARIDFRLQFSIDWHDPRIRQVFILMIPVTIGLGIVNLDQLINTAFGGTSLSPGAARDRQRISHLHAAAGHVQRRCRNGPVPDAEHGLASRRDAAGMRNTIGIGMRQINLLLIPAAAFMIVLPEAITRLVFQRGHFNAESTELVSIALFWFAFSLPFAGINLLLTRTFFALQRPWLPTRMAAINIVVDIVVSLSLYKPLGIAGLVIGTVAANVVMTALLLYRLRTGFNGRLEGAQTLMITARVTVAATIMAGACWLVWYLLNAVLGDS